MVYPSTAPVNFAPGISSSISSTISPSFLLVSASLLAIIVSILSDVLTNRLFKDYLQCLLCLITPYHYYCGFYRCSVFQTKTNSTLAWRSRLPRRHREGRRKSRELKIFQLTLKRIPYRLY